MIKKSTSFYLSLDVLEHLEQNVFIKSRSDWFETKYREEFMNREVLQKKINQLEQELESAKETLALTEASRDRIIIPVVAYSWIKEVGVERLSKGFHINGVLNIFNAQFKTSINTTQFKKLVEKAKREVQGGDESEN